MKKSLILIVAALLIVTLVFSACGGVGGGSKGSSGGDKITVILPEHEMDTIGFHKQKAEEFTAETGIQVELINKAWDAVADDVLGDLASGGGTYDVIEFDNGWVAKFLQNEWVLPLNDYMSAEQKSGLVPALLDKFSGGGKHYGIVWNNDTRFYMYNEAMVKSAGFTDAPKTWADVTALSKALGGPAYMDAYRQLQDGTNEILFVVFTHGGNLLDANNNPIANTDPGAKAAYEWLAQAYKDGVFGDASLTYGYMEVAESFFGGNFPLMLQAWPGIYADANNPDMSTIVGDIRVADFSVSKTGAEQFVWTLPEAMAIPTTSKNPDAAWKYIEYMSSFEFDKERALAIGSLPVWSANFNDAELLALYPYWKQFGEQSANAGGYPDIIWFDDYSDIVAKVSQKIIAGNIGVQEGLDEMQALLEAAKAAAE